MVPYPMPQNGAPGLSREQPPGLWGSHGDHAGTTQEPLVDHLLTFLPSSPGVPSSPWGQRLPVSAPLTHLSMGTNRGMAQSMGVLCHSSPCLMLYWDHYPSASWESPKVKPCFPYSHSCRSGQVCHPHQVCPGRKKRQ